MATAGLMSTGNFGPSVRFQGLSRFATTAWLVLFGAAYVLTANASWAITVQNSYVGLIWAPNALLVSALLLAPRKSWWSVIAVAGVAHMLSMGGSTTWWRMAWQIPANVLFAMAAAEAIRRFIGGPLRLERGRDVFIYTGLAVALPMLLALISPAFVLAAVGREHYFSPGIAFLRIALANVAPLLLVTPAVVLWARLGPGRMECGLAAAAHRSSRDYRICPRHGCLRLPREPRSSPASRGSCCWPFPPLIWAAVRLGPTGASTSLLCVAALSIWGAAGDLGPFVAAAHIDVVMSLLIYWIVIGPPVMLLAAVIRERELAEASLHEQRSQLAQVMRIATAGELSMEMAHELRQPMQAILANAWAGLRLLTTERPDLAQLREILEDIVQQDQQASRVVARLRSVVKEGEPKLEPLALESVVVDALALTRHAAGAPASTFRRKSQSALPRVRGDHAQLLQVLVNLVVNACESMIDAPDADRILRLRVGRAGPRSARPIRRRFRRRTSGASTRSGVRAALHDQGRRTRTRFVDQPIDRGSAWRPLVGQEQRGRPRAQRSISSFRPISAKAKLLLRRPRTRRLKNLNTPLGDDREIGPGHQHQPHAILSWFEAGQIHRHAARRDLARDRRHLAPLQAEPAVRILDVQLDERAVEQPLIDPAPPTRA